MPITAEYVVLASNNCYNQGKIIMHFIWKTALKFPAYDETKRGKQRLGFKTTYGMV